MKFRKLRIAWSVVWGIACVLIIALWIRSYWQIDRIGRGSYLYADSFFGSLEIEVILDPVFHNTAWYWRADSAAPVASRIRDLGMVSMLRKKVLRFSLASINPCIFPHWFAAVLCAGISAAPFARRFRRPLRVRTLLIATTLAVLELAVYATSK